MLFPKRMRCSLRTPLATIVTDVDSRCTACSKAQEIPSNS
uniref:Uncharacterized protein n=1 Tax=Rhizophora mucronata TaxID=61149 RepID=A0A2P2N0M1_RHIMU